MLRKVLTLSLAAILVAGAAFAGPIATLSATNGAVEVPRGPMRNITTEGELSVASLGTDALPTGPSYFLKYDYLASPDLTELADWVYYGPMFTNTIGDSMFVLFEFPQRTRIYAVDIGWEDYFTYYNAAGGNQGTFKAFIADRNPANLADRPSRLVPFPDAPLSTTPTPIGTIRAETGEKQIYTGPGHTPYWYEWDRIFDSPDLPGGYIEYNAGEYACVGVMPKSMFGPYWGWSATYQPWLAQTVGSTWQIDTGNGLYHSGRTGRGSPMDMVLRMYVSYPDGFPAEFSSLQSLPSTVATNATVEVAVNVQDDADWSASTHSLSVNYKVGSSGTTQTGTITQQPLVYEFYKVNIIRNQAKGQFTYNAAAGDTVFYWFEATDADGLNSTSAMGSFVVMGSPDPTANVLIIDDSYPGVYAEVFQDYISGTLMNAYVWDVAANGGLSKSVLAANSWDGVIVASVAGGVLPDAAGENWSSHPLGDFINAGGNLIVLGADYLPYDYSGTDQQGNDIPVEFTYTAGDFAYDVLGVGAAMGELMIGTDALVDTMYVGASGDPVSGDFSATAFEATPTVPLNDLNFPYGTGVSVYSDYITEIAPSGATKIFWHEKSSLANAVRYSRADGGITVFFSFEPGDACTFDGTNFHPTSDYNTLMDNVFTHLGVTNVRAITDAPEAGALPTRYALEANYPNPFNPTTSIRFQVPQTGNVTLKVFNIQGQEVATLFDGNMAAGAKTVTFDGRNLASGVYLYQMQAGDFVQTRKMLLVK